MIMLLSVSIYDTNSGFTILLTMYHTLRVLLGLSILQLLTRTWRVRFALGLSRERVYSSLFRLQCWWPHPVVLTH